MSDYYLDGDFSVRSQAGPEIISLDPITRAHLCRRTVYMDKDAYVPMRQPNSGITGLITRDVVIDGATVPMYFYEETQPRDTGSGIIELDEFYAEIPVSYIEPGIESYTYQWYQPAWGGGYIIEATKSTSSQVVHTFGLQGYDGTLSDNITRNIAPRIINWPGALVGTTVKAWVGDFNYYGPFYQPCLLAKDSDVRRWHGPISERIEIFVPLPSVNTTLP